MRLSKDLGVPMYKAVVESAEFAHNFSMTEPPIMYMQKLDAMKAFRPNGWSGTKYMDNGEVFAPLEDMVNALSAKSESMDNMQYKVTLNKKSAKLMAAEKDGIAYVNVKEFYEGLGFKTQWQAESATISVGA